MKNICKYESYFLLCFLAATIAVQKSFYKTVK